MIFLGSIFDFDGNGKADLNEQVFGLGLIAMMVESDENNKDLDFDEDDSEQGDVDDKSVMI